MRASAFRRTSGMYFDDHVHRRVLSCSRIGGNFPESTANTVMTRIVARHTLSSCGQELRQFLTGRKKTPLAFENQS
jgi:hypothetical protein